jgi:hypothetical protein
MAERAERESLPRRERGVWGGSKPPRLKAATTSGVEPSLVIVAEEKRIRAFAGAEDPAERQVPAIVTDPLEADGALVEVILAIVDGATNTFHGSCLDRRGV